MKKVDELSEVNSLKDEKTREERDLKGAGQGQQRILITGANGQLGLELQKQLSALDSFEKGRLQIIPTDSETMDITDAQSVQATLESVQPHVVINCAAYTAVDKCEEDQEEAYQVNSIGPLNLAKVCEAIGAKLVQVSTDYVFSGDFNGSHTTGDRDTETDVHPQSHIEGANQTRQLAQRIERAKRSHPWKETDPTAPTSIYGKSKREGEVHVQQNCTKHYILRTAWLYGDGNNFVRTMLKLAQTNTELNVVADQFGNPTSAKELAKVIIHLIQTEHYGTYHATCEGVCSWYTFAVKIFELKGIKIKVNPILTEAFPRPAKRPHYSALEKGQLAKVGLNTFKQWEEALEAYLLK